jgi:hypothetical protein
MTPTWDPSLVAQLVSAGCNARAISVVFGLSKNAVLGRLHRDRDLNKLWTDMVAAQRPPKKYKPKPKHRASPPAGMVDPPTLAFVKADWKNWEEREGKKRAMEGRSRKPHMLLVPLLNLGANQCRWPEVIDNNVVGGYLFCGSPTTFGDSYCQWHKVKALAKGGTA